MTESRSSKVERLFHLAVDLPVEERKKFLDEHCGSDATLRAQLERLLQREAEAGTGFLKGGGHSPAAEPAPGAATEQAGMMIGRYKLLTQIGEGGMGLVWLAEQSAPVRRKVALKILKPGMDTKEVLARFEVERNALTIMNHAGIARVYDAGMTERGRPYFVMEYVEGVPLPEFCDAEKLTTADRLRVFLQVCDAVHHAHQKGIIHRDLKPSNILVMLQDGRRRRKSTSQAARSPRRRMTATPRRAPIRATR